VVIQQNSCKLLMMDILMSETCWAHKKWNKTASDIKLVFYSSTMYVIYCVRFDWRYDKCRTLEITSDSLVGMYCASRNYASVWIYNCLQLFIVVLTGSYMIHITAFREDILNTCCGLWFVDFLFIFLIGIALEMSDGEMLNKGHLAPVYLSPVSFLDKIPAVLVLEHTKHKCEKCEH